MFDSVGWGEVIPLVLIGLFIFGPDRLPKMISDGVKMLRTLRTMARNATGDLSRELGTNIELEDLNPRTFVRKHVLSEEDEQLLRRPFQELYDDVQDVQANLTDSGPNGANGSGARSGGKPAVPTQSTNRQAGARPRYDTDAT